MRRGLFGASQAVSCGPSTSPLAAMKTVTQFFGAVDVLSGVLFIAGGLWYGRFLGVPFVVAPLILGIVVIATHASNLTRLRNSASRVPRWLLIVANFVLFVSFVLGQVYTVQTRLHGPLFLWVFGSLYLLPFAMNLVYWIGFDRAQSGN